MPIYRVLEKSYLPDGTKSPDGTASGMCRIYEAGETINYDGLPGSNLEPTDVVGMSDGAPVRDPENLKAGQAKQVEYAASLARVQKERAATVTDDPNAFAEKVAGILEDGLAKAVASMTPPAKGKG